MGHGRVQGSRVVWVLGNFKKLSRLQLCTQNCKLQKLTVLHPYRMTHRPLSLLTAMQLFTWPRFLPDWKQIVLHLHHWSRAGKTRLCAFMEPGCKSCQQTHSQSCWKSSNLEKLPRLGGVAKGRDRTSRNPSNGRHNNLVARMATVARKALRLILLHKMCQSLTEKLAPVDCLFPCNNQTHKLKYQWICRVCFILLEPKHLKLLISFSTCRTPS